MSTQIVVNNPYNILRTNDFDPEKLSITEAKKTKYNTHKSFINYPNKLTDMGKVYYQTPIMSCPFGLTESKMNEDDEPKYYLEMAFNATTDKLEGFHKKARNLFEAIDKRMIDVAVERSGKWFNKKRNREAIKDDKYKSALKCKKNEDGEPVNDYPDRLSFKIYIDDNGKPNVNVFNHLKEQIEVNTVGELSDLIHNGRRLKATVQASSVWISKSSGCGISWIVLNIKLYPSQTDAIEDYAFGDDSNSDSDVEELE